MYIGEVAKKTGLSIKAIRLYEDMGLIVSPVRKGRYRVYTKEHIEVLTLIKEAKALGATLNQLKDVLVYKQGNLDWLNVREFLIGLRTQLKQQILALEAKVEQIDKCIQAIEN